MPCGLQVHTRHQERIMALQETMGLPPESRCACLLQEINQLQKVLLHVQICAPAHAAAHTLLEQGKRQGMQQFRRVSGLNRMVWKPISVRCMAVLTA